VPVAEIVSVDVTGVDEPPPPLDPPLLPHPFAAVRPATATIASASHALRFRNSTRGSKRRPSEIARLKRFPFRAAASAAGVCTEMATAVVVVAVDRVDGAGTVQVYPEGAPAQLKVTIPA
jgi:hypothetical protein